MSGVPRLPAAGVRATVARRAVVAGRALRPLRSRQRGLTLFGLMFWGVLIGFAGYLLVRVLPTLNEYFTIQKTIDKIAAEQPSTVIEVRQSFDRQKSVEYSIDAIGGSDLKITKENDKVVIGFAYERQVPLFGPVFLLIKYEGRSR